MPRLRALVHVLQSAVGERLPRKGASPSLPLGIRCSMLGGHSSSYNGLLFLQREQLLLGRLLFVRLSAMITMPLGEWRE